jgi:Transmembrane domain of unknown function (DUF3566)
VGRKTRECPPVTAQAANFGGVSKGEDIWGSSLDGVRGRIRRGVRVRRVVRRLELWSVFKIGLLFHLISGIMSLAVGIGLWTVAAKAGLLEKLASFLGDLLGTTNFQINGGLILEAALPIVGALVVVNVVATVVLAFVYNMLSGIFGGLVLSVLQEIPKPGTVAAQVALVNGSIPQLVPATRNDRKAFEAKVRADELEAREAARKSRDRSRGARAVKVTEQTPSSKASATPSEPLWAKRTESVPASAPGSGGAGAMLGNTAASNGTAGFADSDPTGSWMATPGSGLSDGSN